MISILLRSVAVSMCIMCVYPELKMRDRYLNIRIQENIAVKTSRLFEEINTSYLSANKNYRNKMAGEMEKIINEIAFYDRVDVNYLDNILFDDDTKPMNFKDLRYLIKFCITKIDTEYERFKSTIQLLKNVNRTLLDIKPAEYPKMMELNHDLHTIIISEDPNDSSTFLHQFRSRIEWVRSHCCDLHFPPMQFVMFQLYMTLVSSQLKSFAVNVLDLQYRYAIDKNMTLRQLDAKLANDLAIVKNTQRKEFSTMNNWIAFASREIDNCLSKNLTRDVNFIELERVFQLVVLQEQNFVGMNSCSGTCKVMEGNTLGHGKCDHKNCVPCEGIIKDCRSEPRITFCPHSNSSNSRRYDFMMSTDDQSSVRSMFPKCPDEIRIALPAKEDYPFGRRCEYCICTCEESTPFSRKSTFLISSQLMTSDVEDNMVITGVKFVKVNRKIYTQIKQAKIMPGGLIDQNTEHWKYLSDETNRRTEFITINSDVKEINLNDLNCPSGDYVLTGIGLGMSNIQADRIALFIKCHLIDFKQGKVLSNYTGPFEDLRPHGNKVMTGRMPADRAADFYDSDKSDGYYIEFVMSHPEFDAGQSVIPWFDAQHVMSLPNVPLEGAGLHYKGGRESGGFLNYKLLSIRYSMFL